MLSTRVKSLSVYITQVGITRRSAVACNIAGVNGCFFVKHFVRIVGIGTSRFGYECW